MCEASHRQCAFQVFETVKRLIGDLSGAFSALHVDIVTSGLYDESSYHPVENQPVVKTSVD